jgi:beta-lactamase regulating signal transducer with metallopeptidase domain
MSPSFGTGSPAWSALGWTMIHLSWVGLAIGLALAIARRLLKSATPETRYAVALAGLLALAGSPVAIFARIYGFERPYAQASVEPSSRSDSTARTPTLDRPWPSSAFKLRADPQADVLPSRTWLARAVPVLPWAWLVGSTASIITLATGLVGVEGLRRSSRPLGEGAIALKCQGLADSLGIKGRVAVATCERLAGPVLLGIVRPMVLLPTSALDLWTFEQIEMALLHELAHLKRWDNQVNLLQRLVESLLFFHPAAWWVSAWVRLERELCCDRVVVERTGNPASYARLLASLALGGTGSRLGLGMADHQVSTRIRRILNLKDKERPMKMNLTLPEGFGLIGAAVVALGLALTTHARPPETPGDLIRVELRKAVAEAAKTPESTDEEGMDVRGNALTSLADAQLRIGDREGALSTLDLVCGGGDSARPQAKDLGRLASLIEAAEVRREAGDLAGSRSALDRVVKVGLTDD